MTPIADRFHKFYPRPPRPFRAMTGQDGLLCVRVEQTLIKRFKAAAKGSGFRAWLRRAAEEALVDWLNKTEIKQQEAVNVGNTPS